KIACTPGKIAYTPDKISCTQGKKVSSNQSKNSHKVPYTPGKNKFPTNLQRYAVDWHSFEVTAFPVQPDMKRILPAEILTVTGGTQGVLVLHCQPRRRGPGHAADECPQRRQVQLKHVYALGHDICGSEVDEYNVSRVLLNTSRSTKNLAGIVVGGKAWRNLRKHYGGSYDTAKAATEEDEVLKDANAKAYCISRNRVVVAERAYIACTTRVKRAATSTNTNPSAGTMASTTTTSWDSTEHLAGEYA
ncbi:unnamed protein product, partial [Symbiodinium microadriaticum]